MCKKIVSFPFIAISIVLLAGCSTTTGQQIVPTGSSPVLTVDTLITGLEVPWAIDFAPDGRIFVTERPGRIRIIKDGKLFTEPWLTIDVTAQGEGGLLGLALDKQFSQNKFVYCAYTYRNASNDISNRLVRLREDPQTGKGVLDRILIDNVGGAMLHDGGRVKIGPDNKIYWTMGENFNHVLAQDMSTLNGKIIRLNLDGTIPLDNPFKDSYIYSYGHRNPQGLAWEPGTGRLYETEHGPSGEWKGVGQDEVNCVVPGGNYGWPVIAGNETQAGMYSPVIQSGMLETWAPSGACFASSGPWAGSFLFAGLRGQTLYRLIIDKNDPFKAQSLEKYFPGQYGRLRDIVEGPDRCLYILTNNRDGRGNPIPDDDRLLKLTIK